MSDTKDLVQRLRTIAHFSMRGSLTGDAADTIERLTAERDALRADAERMRDWIEGDCLCPCCEGVNECSEGCTFAVDSPTDAERMAEARAVLFDAARTGSAT